MPEQLDPYYKWLAIPPAEQPPNHYRLLGLALYESDTDVIAAAAIQRLNWVRKFLKSPDGKVAQRLATEISSAWACLLNVEWKQKYDDSLREHLNPTLPPAIEPAPIAHSVPTQFEFEMPPREAPTGELPFNAIEPVVPTIRRRPVRKKAQNSIVMSVVGGIVGLILGYGVLCAIGPQYDFLGIIHNRAPKEVVTTTSSEKHRAVVPDQRETPSRSTTKPEVEPHRAVPQPSEIEAPAARDIAAPDGGKPIAAWRHSPVPDENAIGAAADEIFRLYQQDYVGADSPQKKARLADKLFNAGRSESDAAKRYVLFQKAKDIAVDAGDWETAFQVATQLNEDFDVDLLAIKTEVLSSVAAGTRSEMFHPVERGISPTFDAALAEHRYDLAGQVADLEYLLRLKSGPADALCENIGKSFSALNVDATNAEANLACGMFLCLVKSRWDVGVNMLTLGSDEKVKAAATQELARPGSPDDQLALANLWWDAAENANADVESRIRERAVHWYRAALPALSGISKALAESRIASADPTSKPPNESIEALPTTAVALERKAQQCRTAKEALDIYGVFLVNDKITADEKDKAKAELKGWEEAAGKDLVRSGKKWIARDEATKLHEDARLQVQRAIELIGTDEQLATKSLEKANQVDPESTDADFLLALFQIGNHRNYQTARTRFASCVYKRPDDSGALNNLAVTELRLGFFPTALTHFQQAASSKSIRVLEVSHNIRRAMAEGGAKSMNIPASVLVALNNLLLKVDPKGENLTRGASGWLFATPSDDSDRANEPAVDYQSLPGIGLISVARNVAVSIEDDSCPVCAGGKRVPCPNCRGGTISEQRQAAIGTNPFNGKAITSPRFVSKACPVCNGSGLVQCPLCRGSGRDPLQFSR